MNDSERIMMVNKLIEKLSKPKKQAPIPGFSAHHAIKTIEILADAKTPISRQKLGNFLSLGEGSVRTLLARLEDDGVVKIQPRGTILTNKGKRLLKILEQKISRPKLIDAGNLTVGKYDIAIQVRKIANKIKMGLEQRDAAIMVGADGATTLVFKNNKLLLPYDPSNIKTSFPNVVKQIFKEFKLEENDAVIIGSASTIKKAEEGARAAACISLKNFFKGV